MSLLNSRHSLWHNISHIPLDPHQCECPNRPAQTTNLVGVTAWASQPSLCRAQPMCIGNGCIAPWTSHCPDSSWSSQLKAGIKPKWACYSQHNSTVHTDVILSACLWYVAFQLPPLGATFEPLHSHAGQVIKMFGCSKSTSSKPGNGLCYYVEKLPSKYRNPRETSYGDIASYLHWSQNTCIILQISQGELDPGWDIKLTQCQNAANNVDLINVSYQ